MRVFWISLIGSVFLVGCGAVSRIQVDEGGAQQGNALQPPFAVDIEKEFVDNHTLYVLVSVVPQTEWKVQEVGIRLRSLRGGEVGEEVFVPIDSQLEDSSEELLRAGKEYRLALSLPVKNASSYQVELLWGDEASRAKSLNAGGDVRFLVQEILPVPIQCEKSARCLLSFQVEGTVLNNLQAALEGIVVELTMEAPGLSAASTGALDNSSEGARTIELPIDLGAGKQKKIRLVVDDVLSREAFEKGTRLSVRLVSWHTSVLVHSSAQE